MLCFAGGIGITPFITFGKEIAYLRSPKKMHLVYCASKKEDFLFVDEFAEITQTAPSITLRYRETALEGRLTQEEIAGLLQTVCDPDIYICGSQSFVSAVSRMLQSLNYSNNKIFTEQFVHAG